jgi:hypothetical protein
VVGALATCVVLIQTIIAGRQSTHYRRLRRAGVAESLLRDSRAPVLFLRSFSLDTLPASVLDSKAALGAAREYVGDAWRRSCWPPHLAVGRQSLRCRHGFNARPLRNDRPPAR